MKKILKLFIAGVIFLAAAQAASAQVYVRVRPTAPRVERVVAPSPRHVWVDNDWRYENNQYVYNGGRWVEPPQGHHRWVNGHWKRHGKKGWEWKEGRWED